MATTVLHLLMLWLLMFDQIICLISLYSHCSQMYLIALRLIIWCPFGFIFVIAIYSHLKQLLTSLCFDYWCMVRLPCYVTLNWHCLQPYLIPSCFVCWCMYRLVFVKYLYSHLSQSYLTPLYYICWCLHRLLWFVGLKWHWSQP